MVNQAVKIEYECFEILFGIPVLKTIEDVVDKYPNIIAHMQKAAVIAGLEILDEYQKKNTVVNWKSEDSPLTAADLKAHYRIVNTLEIVFPDITIISEEGKMDLSKGFSGIFFIIDPLDGTKEFIKKTGEFTVNIGLICNKKAQLGVVYIPVEDKLYSVTNCNSSICIEKASKPYAQQKISRISVRQLPKEGATIVVSESHKSLETEKYCNLYNPLHRVSAGSSLKFCRVSEGKADYYPRLGRTMEWDTAAAHAILKGAGGNVFNICDTSELLYGKPGMDNDYFIATAQTNRVIKSKLNWR